MLRRRLTPFPAASARSSSASPLSDSVFMRKTTLVALVVLAGLIVSGGFFLLTWDIPPPSAPVEKVLPDDRFPR